MLALLKYLSKIAPRRFDAVKQNELTKVLMRQRRNGLLAQRQSSGLLIHWSRVRSPHNPPLISCILSGSLAQLVEQRTLNPLVAGSNPSRPTMLWMLSSVWLEHLPYKQRVIGSSPIASTIIKKNPIMGRQLSWQSSGLLIRWSRVRTPHDPPLWMLSSVWLEHLPYKQRVIGSSPIASTIFFEEPQGSYFLSFCCIYQNIKQKHSHSYLS